MSEAVELWSVGHSDRSWTELLELLRGHGIGVVADVRRYPGSRRHPWFARGRLQGACREAGIAYAWLGDSLGGYRRAHEVPDVPAAELAEIDGEGFRRYAAHLRSAEAAAGLDELLDLGRVRPTAMLCAERAPERCHRRLIADLLVARGHTVCHLLAIDEARVHHLPAGARVIDGWPRYPDPQRLPGL